MCPETDSEHIAWLNYHPSCLFDGLCKQLCHLLQTSVSFLDCSSGWGVLGTLFQVVVVKLARITELNYYVFIIFF